MRQRGYRACPRRHVGGRQQVLGLDFEAILLHDQAVPIISTLIDNAVPSSSTV